METEMRRIGEVLRSIQYHPNWITYRSTCEALKHEKYLYLAKAGPYAAVIDAHVFLAERIESSEKIRRSGEQERKLNRVTPDGHISGMREIFT
jgi:uncharacterized protein YdeI (BOF family)